MPNIQTLVGFKPPLRGLLNRKGVPTGSVYSPYRPSLGGYVIGSAGYVTWASLQTTQAQNTAGTIAGHNPDFSGSNAIDTAILEMRAYNAAHSTSQGLKLRIAMGINSPTWAQSLGGAGFYAETNQQGNVTASGTCPLFWTSAFGTAAANLEAALIAAYDNVPEILEVVIARCQTVFTEPMIRQQINDPTYLSNAQAAGFNYPPGSTQTSVMTAAGYVSEASGAQRQVYDGVSTSGSTTYTSATAAFVAGDVGNYIIGPGIPTNAKIQARTNGTTITLSAAATKTQTGATVTIMGTGSYSDQKQQLDDLSARAAWQHTRIGYAFNPYAILPGSGSDAVFTFLAMKHAVAMLGVNVFSAENNSLREGFENGQMGTMYQQEGNLGTLNGVQTATIGNINNLTTLTQWAIANINVGHLELPDGYPTSVNPAPLGLSVAGAATLTGSFPTLTVTTTTPNAPPGLQVVGGNTNITATWNGAYNGGVSGNPTYTVQYRTTAGPGAWNTFASGLSTLTSTITGLTNGTSYDVRVGASNVNGGPIYSSPQTTSPIAAASAPSTMAAPTALLVANNEIYWQWVAPASNGAAITSYTITETIVGGASLTPVVINDGPPPSLGYDDTALFNGVAYTATVTAHNSAGDSSASPASAQYTPAAGPSGGDVLAGPTVNVDVSAWLTGQITITRGRSRETDQYQAGTLTITLRNEDDRFDPTWTSSPYYPGIVPRVPVALFVNGVQIFGGYVDDFQPDYEMPSTATVTVSAIDGFTLLANTSLSQFAAPRQTSGQRIRAVLQRPEIGYPSSYSLNTGLSMLQESLQDQVPALDHIQTAANSEGGLVYCDRMGVLQFKDRTVIPLQYASWPNGKMTLTDTGSSYNGECIGYTGISTASTSTLLFNQVGGSRTGGAQQIANDAASQELFLVRALSLPTLENETDDDVLNLCNFYLGRFASPEVRFDTITVEHHNLTQEQSVAMASLDITDVIVAERTRPGGHGKITQLSMIEAVSWSLDASSDSYTQTIGVQNVSAGGYFILDDPNLGILDQTPLFF